MRPTRATRTIAPIVCAAALVLAAFAFGADGIAQPLDIGDDLRVELGGGFSAQAPFWERIYRAGGEHPPALRELRVEAKKGLDVDLRGVPDCKLGGRGSRRSVAEVRKACGRAVVGSGRIDAEVEFSGERPLDVSSELLLLKAKGSDGPALYLYAYLGAPATQTLIAPVTAKKSGEVGFGHEMIARIPEIAGDSGSITYFRLGLGKSVLRPTCIAGQPWARVTSVFEDGTKLSAGLIRSCKQRRR